MTGSSLSMPKLSVVEVFGKTFKKMSSISQIVQFLCCLSDLSDELNKSHTPVEPQSLHCNLKCDKIFQIALNDYVTLLFQLLCQV